MMADADPTQKTRQDALREDVRFRLLRALAANPGLSQRGLAEDVGVSLGAVNGLLNGLIETGLVQIRNAEAAPGRFRFAYVLTRKGKAAKARLAGGFLDRRRAEVQALTGEIAALEAELGQSSDPPA